MYHLYNLISETIKSKHINNIFIIILLISGLILFVPVKTTAKKKLVKPNILWITCEDISPSLGCYGDRQAHTPNLDKLASEGILYTEAYSTAGVCAPSRSAIITGMYPISIGTNNMRTAFDIFGFGYLKYKSNIGLKDPAGNNVPQYATVIPKKVKCFPELLRIQNYYCTNNWKTDYQFPAPLTVWDECDQQAHWRNRPADKPFFSVFNLNVSHESQIWKKKNDKLHADPQKMILSPYFPNDSVVRQDVARNYSNITELDQQVGELLNQLRKDGLYDKTIIFFFSDHGGPLPRGKREIYDSGLRIPLIVRIPNQKEHRMVCNDLVSLVDMAPTVLSLSGIKIPSYLQGSAFLGKKKLSRPRKYIYGARDRMDSKYDMVRSIRNKKFLFIRNYMPERPNYQNIEYRLKMDMMNRLLELNNLNKLNDVQKKWFLKTKPEIEFYDVQEDPYQLNNIANNPQYAWQVKRMHRRLIKWQHRCDDKGFIPEGELVKQMWPELKQPQTATPEIKIRKNKVTITCPTKGASIAYRISKKNAGSQQAKEWKVYHKPLYLNKDDIITAQAFRIGYARSSEVCRSLRLPPQTSVNGLGKITARDHNRL